MMAISAAKGLGNTRIVNTRNTINNVRKKANGVVEPEYCFFRFVLFQAIHKLLHPAVNIIETFTAGEFYSCLPIHKLLRQLRMKPLYLFKCQPFRQTKINLIQFITGIDFQIVPSGNDFGGHTGTTQVAGVNNVNLICGQIVSQLLCLLDAFIA